MQQVHRSITGKYSQQQFLNKFWQKAPLLVRAALPNFPSPLSPDELAGLACEHDVASRIVLEKGGRKPWEVRHGPFRAKDFRALPKTHWTLLVQGVDRLVPDVSLLLDRFRFIPNWRIEDVMISYAVRGGNVGAHVDNYDVFLIQVSGEREWQIGDKPLMKDEYRSGLDIRLLKRFKPKHKWVLKPGDMLYLPPRFAHHGIARTDDCMTFSVGFRAPEHRTIVASYLAERIANLESEIRYGDPDLRLQRHPGEIDRRALKRVRELVLDSVAWPSQVDDWFGRFVTRARDEAPLERPRKRYTTRTIARKLAQPGFELRRNEAARIAYIKNIDSTISLFCNGEHFSFDKELTPAIELLSGARQLRNKDLQRLLKQPLALEMIEFLLNRGVFYFESAE